MDDIEQFTALCVFKLKEPAILGKTYHIL